MGKRLIQQRRGRGSPTYTAPSHRYFGEISFPKPSEKTLRGEVLDIVHSVGHSAPLAVIQFEDDQICLVPAPVGLRVGQQIFCGPDAPPEVGNILPLSKIPSSTFICNIENQVGDGGKFVRAAGGFAQIVEIGKEKVNIKLPSKKVVSFNKSCRAMIGVVAGVGKTIKPFVKAGKKYHAMKARNKLYPKVCGVAMNAIDHPHGGTHRRTTGRPTTRKRGVPPGKKVGLIAARRTGRKKR